MISARTYLAALAFALLVRPCVVLGQVSQGAPSTPIASPKTQAPAPVVRRPPAASSSQGATPGPVSGTAGAGTAAPQKFVPKYLSGPAPLVKHTPQTGAQGATGTAAPSSGSQPATAAPRSAQAPSSTQGTQVARPPAPITIPSTSFAHPNTPGTGQSGTATKSATSSTGATTATVQRAPATAPPKVTRSFTTSLPRPAGPLVPTSSGPFNRTTVFIDASHGGNDVGSRISDSILEKDVVLQLAFRLRSLLAARGFTVDLTREDDSATVTNSPNTPLSLDARAGMANHSRAVACLLLHATASGRGVHLYSSELAPTLGEPNGAPWLTAQAPWVTQSWKLGQQIGQAITHTEIPLVQSRASIRPLDSLTCPALVVELAPDSSDASTLDNSAYQQRVAAAIAGALVFWQNTAQPPSRLLPAPVALTPAVSAAAPSLTGGTRP